MTLTQNGINYICQNFGNASFCCVDTGLSWYYTASGTQYPETGGTAQAVSRLASGLVDSVTMTSPARGIFTQAQLNTANGGAVTLPDCQQIAQHDTVAEGQWCYSGSPCTTYTNQTDCVTAGCYWYNNSCHLTAPTCPEYTNQVDCEGAGCYWCIDHCQTQACDIICTDYTNQAGCEAVGCFWYNNSCHSNPPPGPINWLLIGALVAAGLVSIVFLVSRRRK